MSIETKTNDYKSHKYNYNVYVEINPKTKLGENLLEQYHRETKKQYIDIGRIGYHDEYGRYIIDNYTIKELISVPKVIISVCEQAIDRAGQDVYKLRTYMSKFGQLNFLLVVNKDKAELFLNENIYIENLNHKEDYETLIWRLSYYNQKPTPLCEIFEKFNIKSNPDDYGKSWKEENIKINNIIVSKAKAEMTKQIANKIASEINQKALVASLNYLNKEGSFGKKVTAAYSQKVSRETEINKLATNQKLENVLNHVLINTVEKQTTKKDVKDKTNFKLYKKVIDIQLSCPNSVKQKVEVTNTKQNLKSFLLNIYQDPKFLNNSENEEILNQQKQNLFEKIIDYKYLKKVNQEESFNCEEKIIVDEQKNNKKEKYKDFDGKELNINFDLERFNLPEKKEKKKERLKKEKLDKKKAKKLNKKIKQKIMPAFCNLDKEFEKSKISLGILPKDSKKKKKKIFDLFLDDKQKNSKINKQSVKIEKEDNNIVNEIEKKIKYQNSKIQLLKDEKKRVKKQIHEEKKKAKKQIDEEKKKRREIVLFSKKEEKNETRIDSYITEKQRENKTNIIEKQNNYNKDFLKSKNEDIQKNKFDISKNHRKKEDTLEM